MLRGAGGKTKEKIKITPPTMGGKEKRYANNKK